MKTITQKQFASITGYDFAGAVLLLIIVAEVTTMVVHVIKG